ncbi:chromosomal replication initiator protein DnaA, partial [Mycoplasmopsis bovigenitalium]|uniref:chromosomal replication initiator protein DnaA n=1 Tax=Mycoplasmopsis bovigenitalium TaxID=2112 RepID=UPI00101C3871
VGIQVQKEEKLLAYNESFLNVAKSEITDKMILKNFFMALKIVNVNGDNVEIDAELTTESINIIKSSMRENLEKILKDVFGRYVNYIINSVKKIKKQDNDFDANVGAIKKNVVKNIKNNQSFLVDFTFKNYIESEFNKDVVKMAKSLVNGELNPFNVVFIFGNSGLGKTHLFNAIGNELIKQDKSVIYINPTNFVTEISILLQENNQKKIYSRIKELNEVSVLMFDDFQNYGQGNKKSTLNVINQILDHRLNSPDKYTLFASDKQVSALNTMFERRLITRLTQGLQLEIKPPKQADLLKILEYFITIKKLSPENWEIEAKNFVTRNFKESIRSLIGAIDRLAFYGKAIQENTNGKYTEAIVNNILSSIANNKERVTPDVILDYVSKYYKVAKKEIIGKSRKQDIVVARHIAIYIIRTELELPLEKIGKFFGNRDHTTILNAINKIENNKDLTDQATNRAIAAISDEIYKLQ